MSWRPTTGVEAARQQFLVSMAEPRTLELLRDETVFVITFSTWGETLAQPMEQEPKILVVEDDFFIAMDVEFMITQCGCVPVGPVSNVKSGVATIQQTDLDGAVLDVNLGNERVWPVADLLQQSGIPFILATGYSTVEVPERFAECPILHKPLREGELAAALDRLGLARR